jgi:hypothetical protein
MRIGVFSRAGRGEGASASQPATPVAGHLTTTSRAADNSTPPHHTNTAYITAITTRAVPLPPSADGQIL